MPETVPLEALVGRIDDISDDLTIYVADTGQLSLTTPARAQLEPADGAAPPGMRYLLEVELARAAIDVWGEWRAGHIPTSAEKVAAVIHYAQNDAYLPTD